MDFCLAAFACDYKLCWYKNTREFFRFILMYFQKLKSKFKKFKILKIQNFRSERKTP